MFTNMKAWKKRIVDMIPNIYNSNNGWNDDEFSPSVISFINDPDTAPYYHEQCGTDNVITIYTNVPPPSDIECDNKNFTECVKIFECNNCGNEDCYRCVMLYGSKEEHRDFINSYIDRMSSFKLFN